MKRRADISVMLKKCERLALQTFQLSKNIHKRLSFAKFEPTAMKRFTITSYTIHMGYHEINEKLGNILLFRYGPIEFDIYMFIQCSETVVNRMI